MNRIKAEWSGVITAIGACAVGATFIGGSLAGITGALVGTVIGFVLGAVLVRYGY